MTRDVLVSVTGTQFGTEGENEPIEVITTGDYYYKNNKHYVLYDEVIEGTDGVTKNTLKFSDGELSIKRSGATNVQMIFNKENKTMSNYGTPYGNLLIGVDTNQITCNESEDKISIDVDYTLDVNYEFLADCKISVNVSPREKGISLL